jgi:hypothetical protein
MTYFMRRCCTAMLFFFCVAFVAVTTAAAGSREDAGEEFAAGKKAEKEKDYAGAVEHYLKSNELLPHAATAYNIAYNYEKLSNFRQAAQYYQTYLDTSDDGPSDRPQIQKLINDLQNKPSKLTVRSSPAGAQITIDGKALGPDPVVTTLGGGKHRVVATANGQEQAQDVVLVFGEPQDIMLSFVPQTGSISVWSTVINTQIWVDGQPIGVAPRSVTVAPGPHRVTAQAQGWAVQQKNIIVQPAKLEQVSFTLVRGAGGATGNGTGTPIGAYTTTPEVKSEAGLVYGIMAGSYIPVDTFTNSTQPSAVFEPQIGYRWNTGEFFARIPISAGDTFFTSFGFGYRAGAFKDNGAHLYYGFNASFDPVTFEGRLGLAIPLGSRIDLMVETGGGVVLPSGSSTLSFIPVMAGLSIHN